MRSAVSTSSSTQSSAESPPPRMTSFLRRKLLRILDTIMQGLIRVILHIRHANRPWLERTDAARDDHGFRCELLSGTGLDKEMCHRPAAGRPGLLRPGACRILNGSICFSKCFSQLVARAFRNCGDVVDRLVRIQALCIAHRACRMESMTSDFSPSSPSSKTWKSPQGPAPIMTTSVLITQKLPENFEQYCPDYARSAAMTITVQRVPQSKTRPALA